jgi:hypothetical protein
MLCWSGGLCPPTPPGPLPAAPPSGAAGKPRATQIAHSHHTATATRTRARERTPHLVKIAEYGSNCASCGERIHPGEMIEAASPGSWSHAPVCPPLPPGTAVAPGPAPGSARTAPDIDDEKPPWCGVCDQRTRLRDFYAAAPYRCPDCHPLGPLPAFNPEIPRYPDMDYADIGQKYAAAIRADMGWTSDSSEKENRSRALAAAQSRAYQEEQSVAEVTDQGTREARRQRQDRDPAGQLPPEPLERPDA